MSLRLYLDSAREPRTPNRSAGEWADFFDGAMELEAKNWPPLLWWAMFSTGDIMEARIADTEDAGTDEHAELLSQWGEATYPYLVVDQRTALSRLQARRQGLTDRCGIGAYWLTGSVWPIVLALGVALAVLQRSLRLVGEEEARAASVLLMAAGPRGHEYALDAAVAEAALRQRRPVIVLTSDVDDMHKLCGDRVRRVAA